MAVAGPPGGVGRRLAWQAGLASMENMSPEELGVCYHERSVLQFPPHWPLKPDPLHVPPSHWRGPEVTQEVGRVPWLSPVPEEAVEVCHKARRCP